LVQPDAAHFRHQSLDASIRWSYVLLPEAAQWLFRQLALFPDGCTVATALSLVRRAPPTLAIRNAHDVVHTLVQHHMIRIVDDVLGERRCRYLRVLRDVALAELAAAGELASAQQHLLQITCEHLADPAQITALGQTALHQQAHAALTIALTSGAHDAAATLALALSTYEIKAGAWTSARIVLERVLQAAPRISPTLHLQLLRQAGIVARRQRDNQRAALIFATLHAQAATSADQRTMAYALNMLGLIATSQGDYVAAEELYQRSLHLWRSLNSPQNEAALLNNLANLAAQRGAHGQAQALYGAVVQIQRRHHDLRRTQRALCNLGVHALRQGDYAQADAYFVESLAITPPDPDPLFAAVIRCNRGFCALFQQQIEPAADIFMQALAQYVQLGDQRGIAYCLEGLAGVAAYRGDGRQAALLFGVAATLREQHIIPLAAADLASYVLFEQAARRSCASGVYEAAYVRDTLHDPAQIIAQFAIEHV
jgi:tetratricopeptide (TPR) repeat protein